MPEQPDASSGRHCVQLGHPLPRVINVDGNSSCPKVISELRRTAELGQRCRPVRYLNNIIEQDHRAIRRRVRANQGFRAFHLACGTIGGIRTMNMIRKGKIRWLSKNDISGQAAFIERTLGRNTE
jgi:transposase-like protein